MKRKLIYLIALIIGLTSGEARGQSAEGTIGGIVLDMDGEPLPAANVILIGTRLGAATDLDGRFTVRAVPAGTYALRVSLLGYERTTIEDITVGDRTESELTVILRQEVLQLNEVRVTADRVRRDVSDVRASLKYLEPNAAKIIPGGAEDVLRGVQKLPGVVAPSDFTSQLVVRGSGPDQNLIVMDDIEIFNPYRLYGVISMFNPETVTDISLITGGFTAQYGDRLSAVLDVTNREGIRNRGLQTTINASVTNANVVLEGALPFNVPGSYIISGRRTYYDLIAGPIASRSGALGSDIALPNFSDLQAKVVFGPFDGHRLLVNALVSRDGADIVSGTGRDRPDSLDWLNTTRNGVLGLAWHFTPNEDLFTKLVASYYRNDGSTTFYGAFLDPTLDRSQFEDGKWTERSDVRLLTVDARSDYVFEKYSLKGAVSYRTGRHTIEGGASIDLQDTRFYWKAEVDPTLRLINQSNGIGSSDLFDITRTYHRISGYVQDRFMLADRLFLLPGLRYDYYDLLGKSYLSPRIGLSYGVDDITTIRAAYGRYRQSPGYEKVVDTQRPNNGLNDLDERYTRRLEAERAVHAVVGVDRWLTDEWKLSVDIYRKEFSGLIYPAVVPGVRFTSSPVAGAGITSLSGWTVPSAEVFDSVTTIPSNASSGLSSGIEIFLEKRTADVASRWSGWISYAYAVAEREERGIVVPFDFDQRHTVNVVGTYRWTDWLDFGITWRYGSNFPYTPSVGVRPRILVQEVDGRPQAVIQTDATGKVILDVDNGGPSNVNSARKPAYHRLDLRLTARTDWLGAGWSFYLDIVNVYNRANVLSYRSYVKEDGTLGIRETNMFPLLPTLGFSVRF